MWATDRGGENGIIHLWATRQWPDIINYDKTLKIPDENIKLSFRNYV